MKSFNELPLVMVKRARWAREQILGRTYNPDIQVDEDELLAWVFNEEDELWYSVDGNYSGKSPKEKMRARREYAKKYEEKQAEYDEKYIERLAQIDYWSKIRQKVLKRDKNTCQKCKTKIKRLDIHHILPRRIEGSDHYDNLITLCHSCHPKYEYRGD